MPIKNRNSDTKSVQITVLFCIFIGFYAICVTYAKNTQKAIVAFMYIVALVGYRGIIDFTLVSRYN